MKDALILFLGLALTQTLVYRVNLKEAMRHSWKLIPLYFLLFIFVGLVRRVSEIFEIEFYAMPLLALVVYAIAIIASFILPPFRRAFRESPNFYLLTSCWISFSWFVLVPEWGSRSLTLTHSALPSAFLWSVLIALLIPVLAGIRERLNLMSAPFLMKGLPLLCLTVGILALVFASILD